jgi:general secretion pathway protein A
MSLFPRGILVRGVRYNHAVATNRARDHVAGYESFFGLLEAPFGIAPNTRFRFESASHQAALAQLTYTLQRRESVVVVTGQIGTGKTLLCRTVVERLDRKTFLSIINDPLVGRDDLLKQMLQDFGIISRDRAKVSAAGRTDLVHALDEFLVSLTPLGAHAVVIIDEAQHAQPELLEEIRLLSNLQDERSTMLQIILVGQPDLESLLARPELLALRQRVSRHVRLEPLSADEVAKYVEHRLEVAREGPSEARLLGAKELERALAEWEGSASEPAPAFTADAIGRVSQLSNGIPRVVNLLCDRAMEAACAANSQTVDTQMVEAAARALDLPVGMVAAAVPAIPDAMAIDAVQDAAPIEVPSPLTLESGAGRSPLTRTVSLVTAVAAILVAIGFGARAWMKQPRSQAPNTATPAATRPAPTEAPRAIVPPPEVAPPQAPPRPIVPDTAPASTTPPPRAGFEVLVASFRTTARANAVAGEVSALGEPVRQSSADGWQQVFAGPFASRAEADAAQQRLLRGGFSGTIVQERR